MKRPRTPTQGTLQRIACRPARRRCGGVGACGVCGACLWKRAMVRQTEVSEVRQSCVPTKDLGVAAPPLTWISCFPAENLQSRPRERQTVARCAFVVVVVVLLLFDPRPNVARALADGSNEAGVRSARRQRFKATLGIAGPRQRRGDGHAPQGQFVLWGYLV